MGISSTTVGIVSTAVVLLLTGFCYYFFFYEEETSTHVQSTSPTDTTLKKILPKKKNAHGSKIFALTKGFNAKTALSHATDHKEHPLYWRELGGHVMAASCVAFSHPQHDLVASGSVDGTVRCAVISQLGTPHPLEVYTKLDGPPDAMSFTQNAKRLVIASLGNIYFYSIVVTPKTRKIELVKHFPCSLIQVHALQLLDVEQWMVVIVAGLSSSDNSPSIQAFNPKGTLINDFQQVKRQGRADKLRPPNATKSLAVSSPDDRFVALCGCGEAPPRTLGDGEVGVFEVERDAAGHTKRLKLSFVLAGHSSEVLCMAWNATGKRLVTCCADGVWRLWDTSVRYNEVEQPRLFSGHQTLPEGLRASHVAVMTGDVVAFVCGCTLLYCLHGNGEVVGRIDKFVSSAVTASSASSDGQFLATVVKNCRRIPLWKAPNQ